MVTLKKTSRACRIPRNVLLLLVVGFFVVKILRREQDALLLFGDFAATTSSGSSAALSQSDYPLTDGVVVAYAISITYCHPDDFIADAAAVLKHSIHRVSNRTTTTRTEEESASSSRMSRYDYQMYAFVFPDAFNCSRSLEKLGYTVLIKDTPIRVEDIRNEDLRRDATTTGCCQEREFLKLYALTLTQHPIVVHLDLDVLLLQPLDALFDAMMLPDSRDYYDQHFSQSTTKNNDQQAQAHPPILKYVPDAMWTPYKKIPITSYFTRDYNMAKKLHETPPNRVNIQGGFWIVQPHLAIYEELRDIILDGHNYSSDWGWGGSASGLAKSTFYGVAQIQGLISYYYSFVRPGISVELNKCSYNNMVDKPRKACQDLLVAAPDDDNNNDSKNQAAVSAASSPVVVGQCQDCRRTPLSQVRSIHLTLCQKPWWCPMWMEEPQCSKFHYEWHRIRQELEDGLGLPRPQSAAALLASSSLSVNTSDMLQVLGAFPHHCRRQGSKGYRPIRFPFLQRDDDR